MPCVIDNKYLEALDGENQWEMETGICVLQCELLFNFANKTAPLHGKRPHHCLYCLNIPTTSISKSTTPNCQKYHYKSAHTKKPPSFWCHLSVPLVFSPVTPPAQFYAWEADFFVFDHHQTLAHSHTKHRFNQKKAKHKNRHLAQYCSKVACSPFLAPVFIVFFACVSNLGPVLGILP